MKPEYATFLELLRDVMLFALDEEATTGSILSADNFFKYLYTNFPREDEEAVCRVVENANDFLLITGPTGGGKSTIIYRALRGYNTKRKGLFIFDIKREIEGFYSMGGERKEQMRFIQDKFKERLAGGFLNKSDVIKKFTFKTLEEFFPTRFFERRFRLMGKYHKTDIEKNEESLEKLFFEDSVALADDLRFILERLTCAEMIRAIKLTLGLEKFVVVFDNVDRFPVLDQPTLFSVALDIHHGGRGNFGTLITVRNKNLMRYEKAGAQGEIVEAVTLGSQTVERIQPHRLSPPRPGFVFDLLEKRINLAIKLTPTQFKETSQLFDRIKSFTNSIFIQERFYNLVNDSYREMLHMNYEFILYISRLAETGVIVNREGNLLLTPSNFISFFYRWLYARHKPIHQFLLEIINKHTQYSEGILSSPIECDIGVVILSWLNNYRNLFLRTHELLKSFETIGVPVETVLGSLCSLYDVEEILLSYVDLGDTERRFGFEELRKGNLRLTITPLGMEFVKSTITKFEFLHQCLAYPDVVSVDSPEMLEPISENMDAKVEKVLDFLKIMGKAHTASLLQIKEVCSSIYSNWERYYRERFCVDRQLVLERVIRSHLIHLKKTHPSLYSKWRPEYERLLRDYHNSFDSSWTAENILTGLD